MTAGAAGRRTLKGLLILVGVAGAIVFLVAGIADLVSLLFV